MNNEFHGKNLKQTVSRSIRGTRSEKVLQLKSETIYAPPLAWSAWREIWAQFAVIAENSPWSGRVNKPKPHVSIVSVSYEVHSGAPFESGFDVEIKGGDQTFYGQGPGATDMTITGNKATALRFRCRAHSPTGTEVLVLVRPMRLE